MILRLIEDINKSLDNDCFFSALALALILPDICGKAMLSGERNSKERYIRWYDEYVGKYEKVTLDKAEAAYLSGDVVYNLRCSYLHSGNPYLEKERLTEPSCKIDKFTLLIEKKTENNMLVDSGNVISITNEGDANNRKFFYEVNVRRLCMILCLNAKAYFEQNPDKFDFFDYTIADLDKRFSSMFF